MNQTEKKSSFYPEQEEDSSSLTVLFCPGSLLQALIKLGSLPAQSVFPRSHKCTFRTDANSKLVVLRIRTNTYTRMTKRTLKREPSTQIVLRECMNELIMALEAATKLHPDIFQQNYAQIREGLYRLMICYNDDVIVQSVLAELVRLLPVP